MASATMLRVAIRQSTSSFLRPATRPLARAATVTRAPLKPQFSSCAIRRSGGHEEETFEEFSDRYDPTIAAQTKSRAEVEEDTQLSHPDDPRYIIANKAR
jgi:hypothetical protein